MHNTQVKQHTKVAAQQQRQAEKGVRSALLDKLCTRCTSLYQATEMGQARQSASQLLLRTPRRLCCPHVQNVCLSTHTTRLMEGATVLQFNGHCCCCRTFLSHLCLIVLPSKHRLMRAAQQAKHASPSSSDEAVVAHEQKHATVMTACATCLIHAPLPGG